MIWGIAAIVSFQLVDTYYVSLLGTTPLAAMTFTFPVTFFVFTIIMGFGIATSSVISRLIGEGREEDVKRVTTHGLALVFCVGVALAVIGYLLRDVIFAAMGADEKMRPLIHQYMTTWFFGVAFMATPFVVNSAIRAAGSTLSPALIMVFAAVEKEPPYLCAMYLIPMPARDFARKEIDRGLHQYMECKASGFWPGYGEEVTQVEFPMWGIK
jgi:Na+-driven multidrug efflux pump